MRIMIHVMLTRQRAAANILCQLLFHHNLTCLLSHGASACLFIRWNGPVIRVSGSLVLYAAHLTPKAGAAGHQPSSQQVADAKIAASRSSQASLHDHKQQLLLANNTAVLDCDRIAPAEQWLLEGDVKVEVRLCLLPM